MQDGSSPAPSPSPMWRRYAVASSLALSTASLFALATAVSAHDGKSRERANIEICESAAIFDDGIRKSLSAPYNQADSLKNLLLQPIGTGVLKHLWMNPDPQAPCFAISDTPIWGAVVSRIPANVVAVEIAKTFDHALIYVAGLPDYTITTPSLFTSFKPGNIYGVYKISAFPQDNPRQVHDYVSGGAAGFLVNGVAIFGFTDTFSYKDKGAWLYDANVAEAAIVNTDIAHATPQNIPELPKSRGIFHNHQMSREVLKQIDDPFVRGEKQHSKAVGFAIDSYPIYGPLGFTSKDASAGLKVLRSSYVKRGWLSADNGGTGHRSSLPGWTVRGSDGTYSGPKLLNLFEKLKEDMLFNDGKTEGPITYSGKDTLLAEEIQALSKNKELKRDEQGYVYWEADVAMPDGSTTTARNYLLKSSDLWAAKIGENILPATYEKADQDKFVFSAVTGAFAEDYEFVSGYGDLDFHNGIDSFLPDRGHSAYHYVTPYAADLADTERLSKASFPYFIGIQFRGVIEPLNHMTTSEAEKAAYLTRNRNTYIPVFDLGVVGKDDKKTVQRASVIETWRATLGSD